MKVLQKAFVRNLGKGVKMRPKVEQFRLQRASLYNFLKQFQRSDAACVKIF